MGLNRLVSGLQDMTSEELGSIFMVGATFFWSLGKLLPPHCPFWEVGGCLPLPPLLLSVRSIRQQLLCVQHSGAVCLQLGPQGAGVIICSTCLIEGEGEEMGRIPRQSEFCREHFKTQLGL